MELPIHLNNFLTIFLYAKNTLSTYYENSFKDTSGNGINEVPFSEISNNNK